MQYAVYGYEGKRQHQSYAQAQDILRYPGQAIWNPTLPSVFCQVLGPDPNLLIGLFGAARSSDGGRQKAATQATYIPRTYIEIENDQRICLGSVTSMDGR